MSHEKEIKTHPIIFTDTHQFSSLAASGQGITHCNQLLKKQRKTMKYQAGTYNITLMASKRKKLSSETVTIVKREKAKAQVKRTGNDSSQICSFSFRKHLARNPVVSTLCLPFPVGNSMFPVISWTKKKAKNVFQSLIVFFSGKKLQHIYERDKQFY